MIKTTQSATSGSTVIQLLVGADELFQSRNTTVFFCVQSLTVDSIDWDPSGTGSSCCVVHVFTAVVELNGLLNFHVVMKCF